MLPNANNSDNNGATCQTIGQCREVYIVRSANLYWRVKCYNCGKVLHQCSEKIDAKQYINDFKLSEMR